jgi:hypothetical protein
MFMPGPILLTVSRLAVLEARILLRWTYSLCSQHLLQRSIYFRLCFMLFLPPDIIQNLDMTTHSGLNCSISE